MSTQTTPLPPLDLNQRYTCNEAIRYLRTSRKTLYWMIATGTLRTIQEGGRTIRSGERAGRRIAGRRYVPGSEIARVSRVVAVP